MTKGLTNIGTGTLMTAATTIPTALGIGALKWGVSKIKNNNITNKMKQLKK
jgi:uncharacterized protein HemX